ncbi:hypothetical protein EZS27_026489 [termite gut metagenome]|uniref:Uncharacterized protein n=1 Tax=termite gut metagenome TaxID=433724 RepID=A0A5J4QTG8_9ZZZZ
MKKILILLLFVLPFVLGSCKKDNELEQLEQKEVNTFSSPKWIQGEWIIGYGDETTVLEITETAIYYFDNRMVRTNLVEKAASIDKIFSNSIEYTVKFNISDETWIELKFKKLDDNTIVYTVDGKPKTLKELAQVGGIEEENVPLIKKGTTQDSEYFADVEDGFYGVRLDRTKYDADFILVGTQDSSKIVISVDPATKLPEYVYLLKEDEGKGILVKFKDGKPNYVKVDSHWFFFEWIENDKPDILFYTNDKDTDNKQALERYINVDIGRNWNNSFGIPMPLAGEKEIAEWIKQVLNTVVDACSGCSHILPTNTRQNWDEKLKEIVKTKDRLDWAIITLDVLNIGWVNLSVNLGLEFTNAPENLKKGVKIATTVLGCGVCAATILSPPVGVITCTSCVLSVVQLYIESAREKVQEAETESGYILLIMTPGQVDPTEKAIFDQGWLFSPNQQLSETDRTQIEFSIEATIGSLKPGSGASSWWAPINYKLNQRHIWIEFAHVQQPIYTYAIWTWFGWQGVEASETFDKYLEFDGEYDSDYNDFVGTLMYHHYDSERLPNGTYARPVGALSESNEDTRYTPATRRYQYHCRGLNKAPNLVYRKFVDGELKRFMVN